jgi:hypothetical protein
VVLDELAPEQDLAHGDRVGGAQRVRHRAHEGLVRHRHVRVVHVEVALVHGHVDRLAHRTTRVVHPGRDEGQLHEVLEVLDRAVAAASVDVVHERRAVDGSEHGPVAADFDIAGGIAGMLGVGRRRGAAEGAGEALGKADAATLTVGAGGREQSVRARIVAELDADFLQDRLGVGLDDGERLFTEEIGRRNVARDVGDRRRGPQLAGRLARLASPPQGNGWTI